MKIFLDDPNNYNFVYDIHSLTGSFFPGQEINITYDADDAYDAKIKLAADGMYIVCDGKERTSNIDFSDRKSAKNVLKRELYSFFSELTGKSLPWGTLSGVRPTKLATRQIEAGASRKECIDFLHREYLVSEEKADLAYRVAALENKILAPLDAAGGYSLYMGVPFCPSTCAYCSFPSYPIGLWKNRTGEYVAALKKELTFLGEQLQGMRLQSVYMGGGTPTSLSAAELDEIFSHVEQCFDLSNCLEYTVEAGRPDSITEDKLRAIKSHGIERISVNPQTMNQKTLDLIGRFHKVEQTVQSFDLARRLGFSNINMDLIMGLPGEGIEDVEHTLSKVKELGPDSLTVHSLAIKRAARMKTDENPLSPSPNTAEHIEKSARLAADMGMQPYYLYRQQNIAGNFENVGYALPGKESIYNILIMEEKQSIFAAGAGASTKLVLPDASTGYKKPAGAKDIERIENMKNVEEYVARIDELLLKKKKKAEELSWP